jgi:phosphoglycolate phosphatase
MYKNIMFDLDGTVTDTGRAITSSVEYALADFGITDQPKEKLNTIKCLHHGLQDYAL